MPLPVVFCVDDINEDVGEGCLRFELAGAKATPLPVDELDLCMDDVVRF